MSAPPGQKLLLVNVPPGMNAGDMIRVEVPGENRTITAKIPPGGYKQFQVAYIPQTPRGVNTYQPAPTPSYQSYNQTQAPAPPPAYNPTSTYNQYNNNNNNQGATTSTTMNSYTNNTTTTTNQLSTGSSMMNNQASLYKAGSGPTHGVVSQSSTPTQCHKVDYEIKGHEMQFVEIVLDPQETVIAEAGAMMFMEDDISFEAKMGDGSNPKQGFFKSLLQAGGRLLTGESLFLTHFTNKGSISQQQRRVAFAAPFPGTIVPIDMAHINTNNVGSSADKNPSIICQKDGFLCAAHGTKLTVHFHKRIGTGFFGGEGFILQKCKGDGMLFVHAGGCVEERRLQQGERLRVDTGCLVAFTNPSIDYSIEFVKSLKSMFFGGEGLFLCTLTATNGPGTVWLQSLPFSRLADRIVAHAPSIGGSQQGEGTALNPLGGMLDGDGVGGGMGFSGF